MRIFVVICLLGIVSAASLGYTYQPSTINRGDAGLSSPAGFGSTLGGAFDGGLNPPLPIFGSGLNSGLLSASPLNAGGLSSGGLIVDGLTSGGDISGGITYGIGDGLVGGLSSGLGSGLGGGFVGGLGGGVIGGLSNGLSSSVSLIGGNSGLNTFSSGLSGIGELDSGLRAPISIVGGLGAPAVVETNKEFYFHSAPEEAIVIPNVIPNSAIRRNLRVVFIKTPDQTAAARNVLQIAREAVDSKTAIYVLSKQHDEGDLLQELNQIQSLRPTKPEVRFIKYRTAQDAINAQNTIRSQYETLSGPSYYSNEGTAPVLNYASSPVGLGTPTEVTDIASGINALSTVSPTGISLTTPATLSVTPTPAREYLPTKTY